MIDVMRQQSYPGSEIVIEQTLDPGVNYDRYVVSYLSEGLKIYAMLTIPRGEKPESGWPIIVFNHGYIPPDQYRTTERYVAYVDGFARSGYIVIRPDYRGHGSSEGEPSNVYDTPAYTVDVLNAMASAQRLPEADPGRVGMWGHSMGGTITLRAMVVSDDIKAGVIWAGVVADYPELMDRWRRRFMTPEAVGAGTPTPDAARLSRRWGSLLDVYGTPEENPVFWASIDPRAHLTELSGPLQLHHATGDTSVPVEYSEDLYAQLQAEGVTSELYIYQGDNHNISNNFSTAMRHSVEFFDLYVKGE
jgi:dipeptidyl aminopeptidase/acylaminoacyl peptidase